MTLYALTTDGQAVTTTATVPPTGARRLDTGAWVTPPADGWTADLLAACGWLPVTEVPRPADTATTTSDPAPVALVEGVPTQQWTVRPWTAEELAVQAAAAQYEADRLTVRAIITDLQAEKARAQAVIDKTNANITGGDTKDVARAAKRIADAAIDLARYVAP